MNRVLLSFCLINFMIIYGINSASIDSQKSENSNSPQIIPDTNLTTNTYYYIKEKSGKYLRWDGNYNWDSKFDGLYLDQVLKDNYQQEWYLFRLEVSGSIVRIKNEKTNSYIYFSNDGSFLVNQNVDKSNFEFVKTTDDWFNIQSKNGLYISNKIVSPLEEGPKGLDLYRVGTTSTKAQSLELTFIKAENTSRIISKDKYVLGTSLTSDDYFCIKNTDNENIIKYLRYDDSNSGPFYGLVLSKTANNYCPNDDDYLFEFKTEDDLKFVRIKNKKTDRLVSFNSAEYFILTDDKNTVSDNKLALVLSINNKFSIKARDLQSNHIYYMSNSSYSDSVMRINRNPAVQEFKDSAEFEFEKQAKKGDNSANVINLNSYNKLLLSIFIVIFALNSVLLK